MVKETQKRHLPHIHMLITMVPRDKPRTSTDIDRVVSAEIPDKETNPELHRIVTSHMIHGPCGQWNRDSPCMTTLTHCIEDDLKKRLALPSQRRSEGALMCLSIMHGLLLLDLKDQVERHGFTLNGHFGLNEPNPLHDHNQTPRIIQLEIEHNMEEVLANITRTENRLNHKQQTVIKTVMESVVKGLGKMIALDASGGTGKTFISCHILDKVRAEGKVALATAASGIAATLLPKGTTFHSRTKCPLILTDESTCSVSEHDSTATIIRMTHLMVVDEVMMMDRRALEAADRTFQWLRGSAKPFGGITMVFSGDWRQILTVVPHGSRIKIIGRCCKSSYLWKNVETLRLTENMRISQAAEHQQAEEEFARFLLDLGEAKIPVVPEEDMLANISSPTWLCERVILCPTNSEVDIVNEYMTKIFPGEEHVCNSVDTADSEGHHMYPTEFLNTLCPSGMPPHRITLKVGMVIMLLRNFDQQNGHCNGSRYIIEQILPHPLVAKSVIGVDAGRALLIPRITLIPSDNIFPFTLRRKQFPVRPCFAMTVNKSQGQSLQRVGVFCTRDFFSHGQFYVAASRVGRSNRLRILALDEETKKKCHFLSNVVYTEVLTHRHSLSTLLLKRITQNTFV
uniref:ATP-dependent DNA helicase n=1 Tax=Sparus aurata TaxID=8175 RepID=A0A671VV85_SPAAU